MIDWSNGTLIDKWCVLFLKPFLIHSTTFCLNAPFLSNFGLSLKKRIDQNIMPDKWEDIVRHMISQRFNNVETRRGLNSFTIFIYVLENFLFQICFIKHFDSIFMLYQLIYK